MSDSEETGLGAVEAIQRNDGDDTPESDGISSDSEEDKQRSLYSVMKPRHIPGKYKRSIESANQDSGKKTEWIENSEAEEPEVKKSRDSAYTLMDSEDKVLEKTMSEEEGTNMTKTSLSDTGCFMRSMIVVEKDTEPHSVRKKSPPPAPPKPKIEKDTEPHSVRKKSLPPVPPKPKKSPTENEQTLNTSQAQPAPKPAPRRKKPNINDDSSTDEAILFAKESQTRESTPSPPPRLEKESVLKTDLEADENICGKVAAENETTSGSKSITGSDNKTDNESIEDEDLDSTVDYGPAEDEEIELKDVTFETNKTLEQKESQQTSSQGEEQILQADDTVTQAEMKDKDCEKDNRQIEDFMKGTEGPREGLHFSDTASDGDQFDNDLQSIDENDVNSSGSEYLTPESQSDIETTTDQKAEHTSDEEVAETEEKTSKESISFCGKAEILGSSSMFGDSFVVLDKDPASKGYESLSSTISSTYVGYSSELVHDDGNEDISDKKVSVKLMKAMFENINVQNQEGKERETNDAVNVKNYTENGQDKISDTKMDSFLVVDPETELPKQSTEPINISDTEISKTFETGDSNVVHKKDRRDEDKLDLEIKVEEISAPVDMLTLTGNEESDNDLQRNYTESTQKTSLESENHGDNQYDTPPPVGPRSLQVRESLKSLTSDYDVPPKVPPKSLPAEKHMLDTEVNQNEDVYTDQSMCDPWQEFGHNPTQVDMSQNDGVQETSDQAHPSNFRRPFYPSHQQFHYYDHSGNPQYPYTHNPNFYQPVFYQAADGNYYQQPSYFNYNFPTFEQNLGQQQHEMTDSSEQQGQGEPSEKSTPDQHQRLSNQNSKQQIYSDIAERKLEPEKEDDGYVESKDEMFKEAKGSIDTHPARPFHADKSPNRQTRPEQHSPQPRKPKPRQSTPAQLYQKEQKAVSVKEENKKGIAPEVRVKVENPPDTPEEHYLFFKGLNPQTNRENLANFVEIITDDGEVNTEDIVFNATKESAVVVVQGVPDLMKASERAKSKGIDGFFPQVFEIDPPKCIAVSCEDEIKNVEGLELYFEHPKAEGGEVVGQSYESEDGSCYVIEFKDPAVVKRVCQRRHEYDRKSLRVSPYYKCKGGEIWDGNLHVIKIPDPVRIEMTKHCVQLLKRDCCKQLVERLEENYCAIEFTDSSLTLKCKLNAKVDNFKDRVKEWELTSRQIVEQFIAENVTEQEIRIHGEFQDQVMTEIRQYIESENIQKIQEIVVCIKETFQICIVGFASEVRQTHSKLQNKKTEVEKRLQRTSETWPFNDLKLRLLDSAGKFQEMRSKYEEIEISVGDGSITVEGDPVDIKAVHVDVLDADSYIKQFKWKHGFFRHSIDFIQTKLKEKVSRCLKENGLNAEWEIDYQEVNGYLFVGKISDADDDYQSLYTECREEVDDYDNIYAEIDQSSSLVVNVFKNCLAEDSLNIPQELLKSEEGVVFAEDIVETYDMDAGIELTDNGRKLWIFGMRKQVEEISRKAKTFLDENAVLEDKMTCGTIEVKFLQRHVTESTKQIENNLKKWKVFFELKDDIVKIWGTREGISKAKVAMRQLCDSIKCKEHVLQKVAVKEVIRNEKENGTIDVVENDTKCIIVLPGEVETFRTRDPEPTRRPLPKPRSGPSFAEMSDMHLGDQPTPKLRRKTVYETPNGVKISLVKGEIGTQDGHVIVVTTSPNLNLSSGAACKSVLMAGGQSLQDECKMKYPNGIKNGEIAVINGGNGLECDKVYLTSLPNWTAVEENPRQTLQKVMTNSLMMAHKHKKMSILFTAMGTGQLKFPHDTVAMEMFQSVIDFSSKHPGTTLKDVRFVLYQKDMPTIKAFEAEERLRIEGDGDRPTYDLQKGVIKIQVAVENIAEQKVDGIVCSISSDMNLSNKGACSALLRAGGDSLQDECKSKYNNSLDSEQVAEITGGKLHCKTVFLVVLPKYSPEAGSKLKIIIETCLKLAQAKGLKSLAFPALGAGNLRYPPDEVCSIMFDTVTRWGVENQGTSVQTVRFIMHAKDRDLIQRFKGHVMLTRGRGSRKDRSLVSHETSNRTSATLMPRSDYNAAENEFRIQGITLQVLQGDILDQKVNVIVCSVNDKLDFVGGVAQALQKKCPEVVKEAQRKTHKFKKNGLVFTKSYGLPAEYIIHVKFVETPAMWKDQMLKCLEKANKEQCKSIAFPLLGTGQGMTTLDPAEIASSLFTAADELAKKHKHTTIKKIHLVVFKTQLYMMNPVVDSLHKAIQWAVGGKQKLSIGEKAKGLFKSAVDLVTRKTPGAMSKDEFQKMVDQTSSLSLKIYSDSEEKITACIKELNLKLEKQYQTMKIEDYKELLKSLTPEEENELENTEIIANIKLDKAAGVITIDGPTRAVGDIKSELQSRLLKIDRRRNEVKIAEENYKLYRWYFEEITATGIEHIEYEKVLNLKIEQAYKANINQLDFKTDKGEVFVIDLVNLVEYPESDKTDTVKVLRKDILKQATAALPQEWAPMKDSENLRRVAVANTDQIYKVIEQRFLNEVKTGQYHTRIQFDTSKVQVSKIERIQNKTLYQQYIAKKKLISEQKPNLPANMPIERDLWHGTTHDAVDSIEMHGFNRSYCGKNGIWFGAGVYFAKCASYSARGWLSGANPGVTGVKGYIFLSKVLTGQYCKGHDKMRYLPAVDPKQPTVLYDCAVDNEQNPMEFVIFHDTQAYPEYIITFTA